MNRLLFASALLGFLSVAIGAAAEHVLRPGLDEETWRWMLTAIRYHQIGALGALAIGLVSLLDLEPRRLARLRAAGWLFVAGTLLFSFSIYAAAMTGLEGLTYVTPFGGVTLMIAWLIVGWSAVSSPAPRR